MCKKVKNPSKNDDGWWMPYARRSLQIHPRIKVRVPEKKKKKKTAVSAKHFDFALKPNLELDIRHQASKEAS